MATTEAFQSATERWQAFALALAAPLGPFPQVHLAPKFPPALLNSALATYLPLQEDELLLAIIDRGGRQAPGRCALTSRRAYWTETDHEAVAAESARSRRSTAAAPQRLVIALYADLPERIEAIESPDGTFGVSLANGPTITLGRVDARLASALAHYLETMGRAARAGAPLPGLIDPEIAARAERALASVASVSVKGRAFGQELTQFRADLFSATPHAVMTPVLTGLCILVYLAMVAGGVHWLSPTVGQLIDWGANQGIAVVLNHQYWRLLTSVFLHGGAVHLAMNMWSLMVIGPLVERLYGNLAYAVIYLASGVGGAIASLAVSPTRVGVGASGAICGVLGALAAFLLIHRRVIPKSILKSFRGSLISVIVFMAILSIFVPNIDQEAHLGGVFTGFLSGVLLSRPWPVRKSRWVPLRRLAALVLIAGALGGVAYAVAGRARSTIPAATRLQVMATQIGSALEEYEAINSDAPGTMSLSRDRDDATARAGYAQTIDALIKRALANLARFRDFKSPYPPLEKMSQAMALAQSHQLASLRAAKQFLETGDRKLFNGPGGIRDERTSARNAVRSFQEQQIKYMRDNQMIKTQQQPGA